MIPTLAEQQRVVEADNAFGFKLLRQILRVKPGGNVFISPYSAATVLQMVAEGAAGETKTEMQQALETVGISSSDIGSGNRQIASSLNAGNAQVILTTANAVWYQHGFEVNPHFTENTKASFDAIFDPLDFNDLRSVEVINAWASKQTHGRINRLADGMIDQYTRLFLANAVYFKDQWARPFMPWATRDLPFHLADGGRKNVPMMSEAGMFSYRQGPDYQAIRLPYKNENLGMYVFLPAADSSPVKLLAALNGDSWRRDIKNGFERRPGNLKMPRFKFDFELVLNNPLIELGMKTAFDILAADFSGIGRELFISGVVQKTFIEVKEEGTEAAAVTAVAVAGRSVSKPPPNLFTMEVDRPFVFLIEDNQTGVILFMGVMFEPKVE